MRRLAVLVLPVLGACSMTSVRESFGLEAPPAPPAAGIQPERAEEAVQDPVLAERQLIFEGWLQLVVRDLVQAESDIAALARPMGGWIQRLERPRLVLRLPSARFEAALESLSGLGLVVDKRIKAADVTDRYRDLKLRLENAEKVRDRLVALLERAGVIPDAIAVEKELARVTEEIERLKGAIAVMQDLISYSTISIELRPPAVLPARRDDLPFEWVRSLGPEPLFRF